MRFERRFFQLFVMLCFTVLCCKKEVPYPDLEIVDPQNYYMASFGDSLEVIVKTEDAERLRTGSILNGSTLVFTARRVRKITDGEYAVLFVFSDRYMESNTYTIRFTAENEAHSKSAYSELRYTGLKKEQEGLCVLTTNKLLYQTDGSAVDITATNLKSLAFAGYYNTLFACRQEGAELRGYKFPALQATFSKNYATTTFRNNVNGFISATNDVYFYDEQGFFRKLDSLGNIKDQVSLKGNPIVADMHDDLLFTVVDLENTGVYEIQSLYTSNGSVQRSRFFPERPVKMVAVNRNLVYIVANNADEGSLYSYKPQENTVTKLFDLEGQLMKDMAFYSGETVIFCTDKTIQTYNTANGNMPTVQHNFGANCLEVDQLTGYIYFANGSLVQRFLPGNTAQYVLGTSAEVLDLCLIYNK